MEGNNTGGTGSSRKYEWAVVKQSDYVRSYWQGDYSISQHLITRTKARSIEAHVNTITAAVRRESGMKRLMDVTDDRRIVFLDAQDYLFIDQEEL